METEKQLQDKHEQICNQIDLLNQEAHDIEKELRYREMRKK